MQPPHVLNNYEDSVSAERPEASSYFLYIERISGRVLAPWPYPAVLKKFQAIIWRPGENFWGHLALPPPGAVLSVLWFGGHFGISFLGTLRIT